jgi:hypothetical protein
MKKLLIGLAVLPLLAGVGMAGQPVQLSDTQMDKVVAGYELGTFSGFFGQETLEVTAFEPPVPNGILVEGPGHPEDRLITIEVGLKDRFSNGPFPGPVGGSLGLTIPAVARNSGS